MIDDSVPRRSRAEVPSIGWSRSGDQLGPTECDPLPLSGSPSIPLPDRFLAGIDVDSAATRLPARGGRELRDAISQRIENTTGVLLDPEREIVVTNGAMHGLDLVFRALVPSGAKVGLLCPTFFLDRLLEERVRIVRFDTQRQDGWRVSERILHQIRDADLDVFILVNPNNPTGVVYTEAELHALVEATADSGALLIIDEAYEAFVYDGRSHVSVLGLSEAQHRVVTVQSFTKSFGLVAARVGTVFGPSQLLDRVGILAGWTTLASNPLSQPLALAALQEGDAWRPQLIQQFVTNRQMLRAAIEGAALPPGTTIPEGATFSMLEISALGIGSEESARQVWRATGIACVPGIEFPGDPEVTDRFLRLPIGAPPEVFAGALDRLGRFFR